MVWYLDNQWSGILSVGFLTGDILKAYRGGIEVSSISSSGGSKQEAESFAAWTEHPGWRGVFNK